MAQNGKSIKGTKKLSLSLLQKRVRRYRLTQALNASKIGT